MRKGIFTIYILAATSLFAADLPNFQTITITGLSSNMSEVSSFIALNGKLYFNVDDPTQKVLRFNPATGGFNRDYGYTENSHLVCLARNENGAFGLDTTTDEHQIVFLDLNLQTTSTTNAGYNIVGTFAPFMNGNFLVESTDIYDIPVTGAEVQADPDMALNLLVGADNRDDYNVFLMDSGFNRLSNIVQWHEPFDWETEATTMKGLKAFNTVKAGYSRSYAAVYNQHRPGIRIFDRNGAEIGVAVHPGNGMLPNPTEFPLPNPNSEHIWYQTDVHIDDGAFSMLVADATNKKIYNINLQDFTVRATWDTPFPVLEMSMDQENNKLYLRGNTGQFAVSDNPLQTNTRR